MSYTTNSSISVTYNLPKGKYPDGTTIDVNKFNLEVINIAQNTKAMVSGTMTAGAVDSGIVQIVSFTAPLPNVGPYIFYVQYADNASLDSSSAITNLAIGQIVKVSNNSSITL